MKGKKRYCVDCRHYEYKHLPGGVCRHEQALVRVDPVSKHPVRYYAEYMRDYDHPCGPEAKLFEARPPTLWQRFKAGLRQARKESGE